MKHADDTLTVVFVKAPIEGEVKTRLIPALGAAGAAQLHRDLVRRTLGAVRTARLGSVRICCAPGCAHSFFNDCADEFDAELHAQHAGSLGDRMYHAMADALRDYARVLLLGTDCPALDAAGLRSAAKALTADTDLVFVPVEDGGYVLIGARRIDTAVFDGVAWGSAEVMQQTRDRLQYLQWHWRELPALWDVDRPQDLERLRRLGLHAVAPVPAAEAL